MILTICKWYIFATVYKDGKLIFRGESDIGYPLLRALGYTFEHLELPTHNIPEEFDRDERGHWKPPVELSVLKKQIAKWKARVKREKIAGLKAELKRLEQIDKVEEHRVFTDSGPIKVSARSLAEAESIAEKDGHRIMEQRHENRIQL